MSVECACGCIVSTVPHAQLIHKYYTLVVGDGSRDAYSVNGEGTMTQSVSTSMKWAYSIITIIKYTSYNNLNVCIL